MVDLQEDMWGKNLEDFFCHTKELVFYPTGEKEPKKGLRLLLKI
jgi:hypothetical protein